jgi:hypothetical protein
MNRALTMSILKTTMGLVLAVVLSACGGGGGDAGGSSAVSGAGTGTTGSTGTGTTSSTVASVMTVTLQDAGGTAVNGITTAGSFTAKAILTDASGAAIPGKAVTFGLSSTIATLSSTTALTDSAGIASVGVAPTAGASSGAVTLTASATVSNAVATGTKDFSSAGASTSAVTIAASLIDSADKTVTSVGSSGYRAKAILKDGNGLPVGNKLVNFSVNSSSAKLTSQTALTDPTTGIATVGISSVTGSAAGAATLTVSATISGADLTETSDFAFSGAVITLSSISGNTSLTSGGNTPLSITAFIGTAVAGSNPVNITFTATCGSINGAIGSSGVTTNGSGVASVNYSAVQADGTPCAGSVTLGATTGTVSATPLTITVANPVASSVAYVGASLNQVYVAGSGAPTDSVLTFKVLTATGTPSTNTAVTYTIPTNPGGVTLNTTSGTTDNSGLVTVKVSAGPIPGPLKVRATYTDPLSSAAIYSESQNLTVASGPPSQRYMSVSLSTFNVEGQDIDGSSTTITARLADRQGNPVQDGTVVNFTASGGQVATSCATTRVNGIAQCSVIWQSQNPRPSNGRVAVLAYTVGTKDYLDRDSSNTFNIAGSTLLDDQLIEMGDPFRDDDENGNYDANIDGFYLGLGGKLLTTANGTQTVACPTSGEPTPSTQATCDGKLQTVVRQQVIILNSSSHPQPLSTLNGNLDLSGSPLQFAFTLRSAGTGNRKLPLPAGTTVTAAFASGPSASCSVTSVTPSTVGNISPQVVTTAAYPDLSTLHVANLKACGSGDSFVVTVTPPSGAGSAYATTVKLP